MKVQNKRLVICSDGTWNTPQTLTNVIKTVRCIKPVGEDGKHQIVFYDQGIGTYNILDKIMGGVFGKGIEQNIIDAYRFIAHNYQAGDEIYCFGFSRGAYTVRALSGMLHTIGVLPKSELHTLTAAYKYYRTPAYKRNSGEYAQYHKPQIEVMAVWDTVGSFGVPTPFIRGLTKPFISFFDTHLSPDVKSAYQALALDEKRPPFQPALWSGTHGENQKVEQVWFCGAHSDVGGGYPQSGLSDISLMWMIEKVSLSGLAFDESYLTDKTKVDANSSAPLHDSYGWPYRLMEKLGAKPQPRDINAELESGAINVSVHESVHERIKQVEDYQPENLNGHLSLSRADERRQYTRTLTEQLLGKIHTEKQQTHCKILDYSPLGGVRVQCDDNLDNGADITISSSKFDKTLATCAWKKDNIYGLHFAA